MNGSKTQIDSHVQIVTPENIAFRYRVAGPFRRMPAFLLDLLIRFAVMAILFILAVVTGIFAGGPAFGAMLIAYFFIEWFYGGVFETVLNGQTPGKWVMGIRVLSLNGQPISPIQAVLRNFCRGVDMMPLLSWQILIPELPLYGIPTFGFALVAAAFSPRFQRLGDIVCGTIVVIEERRWLTGVAKLEDPRAVQLASYIPIDFRPTRSLARALAAYVDRRRFFSPARRREVAHHLAEPLLAQFGFPADTSYDLLLCALYYRTFVAEREEGEPQSRSASPVSPVSPPFPGSRTAPRLAVGPASTPGAGTSTNSERVPT